MKNTRGVHAGATAVVLSAGLLFTASSTQAASIIDIPGQGTNTIQASIGQDVFQPAFTLWPLADNNTNIKTEANTTIGNGNNQPSGQAWLLGFGSGNVVQFATGGNIVAPQFAVGRDNNLTTRTEGNYAADNGNGSTSSGTGLLIDGNGNVFQVAFMQGNIIAPQFAIGGDNNADHTALGNYAADNGNGSDTFSQDGFAFVTGNGNIIQIEILSDNVIAPQFVIGGNNNLTVYTDGNIANDNGNESTTTASGNQNPFAGIFSVTSNGHVTHIAILSNNVWAPQIAILGTNTSDIFAGVNHAENDGNDSTLNLDQILPGHDVIGGGSDQNAQWSGNVWNDQFAFNLKAPVKLTPDPVVPEEPKITTFATPVGEDDGGGIGGGGSDPDGGGNGGINDTRPGGGIGDPGNDPVGGTGDPGGPVGGDTTPKKHPVRDLVRDSLQFLPGHNKADGNSGGDNKPSHAGNWKPGDGVKAVVKAVKDALKPKPKADAPAE